MSDSAKSNRPTPDETAAAPAPSAAGSGAPASPDDSPRPRTERPASVTGANTAAGQGADPAARTGSGDHRRGRHLATALVTLVAVLVVGFSAWSMSEHAAGRDPLAAWGGAEAAQEVAEAPADPTSDDDVQGAKPAAGTSQEAPASSGTAPSGGSADSGSSGSGSSSDDAQTITVTQTVDGASRQVTVPAGSSVYDVLAASGVPFQASNGAFGTYVTSIDGRAAGSNTGWTYTVNGAEPNVGCSSFEVSAGDSVVWTIVTMS